MKGFMFSIEAVISIIILASFLVAVGTYFTNTQPESNYLIENLQSKQATSFYFYENEIVAPTTLCRDIFVKETATNNIQTRSICKWIIKEFLLF